MPEYPIYHNVTELIWITEAEYRDRLANNLPAYTIVEIMEDGALDGFLGDIHVWNNNNGWTGEGEFGTGPVGE